VGARFDELPIVFVDRQFGQTKINTREACRAVALILRLALVGQNTTSAVRRSG
jgi:hypothetical protein